MSTFLKLPPRKIHTWEGPTNRKEGWLVNNQIDSIINNKRFKYSIKSAKTYPEADIPTDYHLLLAAVRVRLKSIETKKKEMRKDFNSVNA